MPPNFTASLSSRRPTDHVASALAAKAAALAASIGMVVPKVTSPPMAEVPSVLTSLSSRELEVLRLVAAGRSNQEIASDLFISYRTVKTHIAHILDKLGARDRTAAALLAIDAGLETAKRP